MAILKHTVVWGPFCRKFLGYLFALLLKGPLSQVLSKESSFNNHFLFIDFTELRGNYPCPSYLLIKLQTVRLKKRLAYQKRGSDTGVLSYFEIFQKCFFALVNFLSTLFFGLLSWVNKFSRPKWKLKFMKKLSHVYSTRNCNSDNVLMEMAIVSHWVYRRYTVSPRKHFA